jgi:undecaprenyl-diphosphatase
MLTRILNGDERLARRCAAGKPPRSIRILIVTVSRGGDGWLWMLVAGALLLFGGPRGLAAFYAALGATVTSVLFFAGLKKWIGRPRPHLVHQWARVVAPDRFSFPSGHAMTAFAIAGAVGTFYPHEFLLLAAIAAGVALSRLLLGLHYLTDVLAGSLWGLALGIWWAVGVKIARWTI